MVQRGGAEGEGENLKQTLAECGAQQGIRSHHSEIMTLDKIKSQTLD